MINSKNASASLGRRLAEERQTLGLSQGRLAELLGLSRNSITQYEADRHLPGADVLAGLDQIGADSHYILTGRRVNAGPITLDLDQMAIALQEARRQLGLPNESQGQREILNRAWIIYLALGAVLNLPTSKGSDSSDEFLAERKNSPRTAASAL